MLFNIVGITSIFVVQSFGWSMCSKDKCMSKRTKLATWNPHTGQVMGSGMQGWGWVAESEVEPDLSGWWEAFRSWFLRLWVCRCLKFRWRSSTGDGVKIWHLFVIITSFLTIFAKFEIKLTLWKQEDAAAAAAGIPARHRLDGWMVLSWQSILQVKASSLCTSTGSREGKGRVRRWRIKKEEEW